MLPIGNAALDADRAFARAARARRRAAWWRAVLRVFDSLPCCAGRLAVLDDRAAGAARLATGVREVPVDAITATLEPGRAALFDDAFRPAPATRTRWRSVWLAEHRGAVLPPVCLVRTADGRYAVADGHHRVSVARARGARTIDAFVGA